MDLLIRGNNVAITPKVRDLVAKKTLRLNRYLPQAAVVSATLDLRERTNRSGPQIDAEMTIATRGALLRAEARAPELAPAIDEVTDRMYRQIVRFRSRRRDLKRQVPAELDLPPVPEEETAAAGLADDQPRLVRTKRFVTKPMDAEEAIEQLELIGHDFYVFIDQASMETQVVYRRRDGGYGVLQPQMG